jgi:hypothetical protein
MAKKTAKTVKKTPAAKKAPAAKKPVAIKPKAPAAHRIEMVCEDILKKLQDLNIEHALQADIAWCLGSYRNDKNPSGLYLMAERALQVFTFEVSKDPKSVPAKLITDITKALKSK